MNVNANMKKKTKNIKLKNVPSRLNELNLKEDTIGILNLKKYLEYPKKVKSPDLEITKDSRFTRRAKSPDVGNLIKHKSKECLGFQTPVKQSGVRSMKNTPNKSLAHIQSNPFQGKEYKEKQKQKEKEKEKSKAKMVTKLTSEGKTSSLGHRKSKSQQMITNKGMNYDMFVTRKSTTNNSIRAFAHLTKAGTLDGKPKTNQDNFIAIQNYLTSECSLFGVCDGHGINGHMVSETIKKMFPANLQFLLIKNQIISKKELDLNSVEYALQMAFKKTACDLLMTNIDVDFSGSTFVSVFIYGKSIWCSNIGDSRAVIFSQPIKGELTFKALSNDHKGQDPIQAKRILGMGGKLESYQDEDGEPVGPLRVWIPGKNVPGLAMTRSFGDYYASTVGVISDPQTIYHKIKRDDKFLVLASDGLWQFIDPDVVCDVVKQYYLKQDCDGACRALQKLALKSWQDQDDIIDDITIIVIFFQK